jgi:hypothetical protein
MKLALIVEYDKDGCCKEDSALNRKQWIVGNIAVTVGPREIYEGGHRVIIEKEPVIEVHGNTWDTGLDHIRIKTDDLGVALDEAHQYARTMEVAITRNLTRLACERAENQNG